MERIAHRGAKREFPENTIAAFRRAFERGADAVELDVHATADGVVVVHHDPDVRRPGSLRAVPIMQLTWDELRSWSADPDTGIPRLSDVVAITPERARLYVELKGAGVERFVAEILSHARVDCAVHSFDHDAIAKMRALAPELPRGVLFERTTPDLPALVRATGARDVWPHWKLIDAALVTHAHALGARVIAWTVNETAVASSLAAIGVDGLCGDDVRLFDERSR